MRAARLAFAIVASAWVVLAVAAPVTAAGAPASAVAYALGSLICHQQSGRSFYLENAQFPVCARCFGLYLGAAIGGITALTGLRPRFASDGTAPRNAWRSLSSFDIARGAARDGGRGRLRAMLVAAALPTALTWGLEFAGLWPFGNWSRFAAALPLGAAVALTVNYVECAQLRPTAPRPPRIRT